MSRQAISEPVKSAVKASGDGARPAVSDRMRQSSRSRHSFREESESTGRCIVTDRLVFADTGWTGALRSAHERHRYLPAAQATLGFLRTGLAIGAIYNNVSEPWTRELKRAQEFSLASSKRFMP